jgi:ribonuclease D
VLGALDGPICVDAERASGFKYSQRAYLLQIATPDRQIWLIDTFALSPKLDTEIFSTLQDAIGTRTWIFHAASQDLPCVRELGLEPNRIVDTELGARLLGLAKVGLGSITETFLGFRLAKEHSAVDWSRRPLDPSWLNYAALDVDVLPDIWSAIEAELAAAEKTEIATQEFAHVLSNRSKATKTEKWRTLSGLHSVKDRQRLSAAKLLWEAREELAIKLDVSPGRLVPDSSITWLVSSSIKSKAELAATKEFHGRASRNYLDIWWDAYSKGLKARELPELRPKREGIPNHRTWPTKFPEAAARLDAARQQLDKIASELNLPVENLLAPDTLRALCFEPDNCSTLEVVEQFLVANKARAWQVAATSERLYQAIRSLS